MAYAALTMQSVSQYRLTCRHNSKDAQITPVGFASLLQTGCKHTLLYHLDCDLLVDTAQFKLYTAISTFG